jgi:hypothetical protein
VYQEVSVGVLRHPETPHIEERAFDKLSNAHDDVKQARARLLTLMEP